jgi:hypothetical protein
MALILHEVRYFVYTFLAQVYVYLTPVHTDYNVHTMNNKTERINIRLSAQDRKKLVELAESQNISYSEVLRRLIVYAHSKLAKKLAQM